MYPETADIETSSDDYARRFSSAAGAWMLKSQEDIVTSWLKHTPGVTILDVGGGHGQLAIPLSRLGYQVTVLGSDVSCSARIQKEIDEHKITFMTGNVIGLPVPDKSFDVAISIRLLPHCKQWQELIKQLCRAARQAVIVDYPTIQSVNVFSSSMFAVKKELETNTRPFALFRHSEIRAEFHKNGFDLDRQRAEFFFPMVLHRVLNKPRISALLELFSKITGLTSCFGSPVLVKMKRRNE